MICSWAESEDVVNSGARVKRRVQISRERDWSFEARGVRSLGWASGWVVGGVSKGFSVGGWMGVWG